MQLAIQEKSMHEMMQVGEREVLFVAALRTAFAVIHSHKGMPRDAPLPHSRPQKLMMSVPPTPSGDGSGATVPLAAVPGSREIALPELSSEKLMGVVAAVAKEAVDEEHLDEALAACRFHR